MTVSLRCLQWGSQALRPQQLKELYTAHWAGSGRRTLRRATSRGHGWRPKLKSRCRCVPHANATRRARRSPCYIPGFGQGRHGNGYMWTFAWWQQMHILSGLEVQVMKTRTLEETWEHVWLLDSNGGAHSLHQTTSGHSSRETEWITLERCHCALPQTEMKRSLKASRGTFTLQHQVDMFLFSSWKSTHVTKREPGCSCVSISTWSSQMWRPRLTQVQKGQGEHRGGCVGLWHDNVLLYLCKMKHSYINTVLNTNNLADCYVIKLWVQLDSMFFFLSTLTVAYRCFFMSFAL